MIGLSMKASIHVLTIALLFFALLDKASSQSKLTLFSFVGFMFTLF